MKKLLFSAFVAILVPVVANATMTTYYSGQMCDKQILLAGQPPQLRWSGWRFCPASWSTSAANGQRNAAVSVDAATVVYSAPLWCNVVEENWDGSIAKSDALYSCKTYGGCTEAGSLGQRADSGQLNFIRPINNGTGYYALSISIWCNLDWLADPGIDGYNLSLTVQ